MTQVTVVRAERFAAACLEAVLEAAAASPAPLVGLPTGNTPLGFYSALAKAVAVWDADVSGWRPIAIDEYGCPREHPCSNRAFFAQHWAPIRGAMPVEQFDPEAADVDAECARMRAIVEASGGLDVAVLGVGMNGHVAFNEPGSEPGTSVRRMELQPESRESARQCFGEATPTWGLTLGLSELLGARRVVVMANGGSKAAIVAAALDGPQTSDVPASFARGDHVTWILDEAAAARVRRG